MLKMKLHTIGHTKKDHVNVEDSDEHDHDHEHDDFHGIQPHHFLHHGDEDDEDHFHEHLDADGNEIHGHENDHDHEHTPEYSSCGYTIDEDDEKGMYPNGRDTDYLYTSTASLYPIPSPTNPSSALPIPKTSKAPLNGTSSSYLNPSMNSRMGPPSGRHSQKGTIQSPLLTGRTNISTISDHPLVIEPPLSSTDSVSLPLSAVTDISATTDPLHDAEIGARVANFILISVIGRGAYGKVFLCQHIVSKQYFAMKVMKKALLYAKNTAENAMYEKEILSVITNDFIVRLYYAFQSPSKLYLVMNYIAGGELFSRLNECPNGLDEKEARFYCAEIVLALMYLHSNNIIYRDLKPENILLTTDGHVCLTDFGFAKKCTLDTSPISRSFVGTLHYMAPEIISKHGYTTSVDWWSLGCLVCEMLTGAPPFKGENRKVLQQRIMNAPLKLPSFVSQPAKNLIGMLLRRSVHKRDEGVRNIKGHAFFAGIDWAKIGRKEVPPPYIPPIESDSDVSRFDKTFTNEVVRDSPYTQSDLCEMFEGFSYNATPTHITNWMRQQELAMKQHELDSKTNSES